MTGALLDLAVRAHALSAKTKTKTKRKRPGRQPRTVLRFPRFVLTFDTETTVDALQQLVFGAWRYSRVDIVNGKVVFTCVAEGLFYADDLPERDPAGFAVLVSYARTRRASVAEHVPDARVDLAFESVSAWVERVLWRAAFELRAAVVCFNSPFDFSRIAWDVGETRTYKPNDRVDAFEGGFSFVIFGYHDAEGRRKSQWRPNIAIKSIDSRRALKGFRKPARIDANNIDSDEGPQQRFTGHLLDLRTLVFALTDRGHTLESACEAFGVPYTKRNVTHGAITTDYVSYCREDVEASDRLCEAALSAFFRHPVPLQATRAYSPATIGRGYLKQMGVTPPANRHVIDPRILGHAMTAYYGGRAECRIRRAPVPVVYCDFKSMYPTVCALMGVWELLTAETINAAGDTQGVSELLDEISTEQCFDPETWRHFIGIAQIVPDGDVVPVRARYALGAELADRREPINRRSADVVHDRRPRRIKGLDRQDTQDRPRDPLHRRRPDRRPATRAAAQHDTSRPSGARLLQDRH